MEGSLERPRLGEGELYKYRPQPASPSSFLQGTKSGLEVFLVVQKLRTRS